MDEWGILPGKDAMGGKTFKVRFGGKIRMMRVSVFGNRRIIIHRIASFIGGGFGRDCRIWNEDLCSFALEVVI